MSETNPDPTDAQAEAEAASSNPTPEKPFNVDDLLNGPDEVVHNSDADPDTESDPAQDDGSSSDWTGEGGATPDGPATDTDADADAEEVND